MGVETLSHAGNADGERRVDPQHFTWVDLIKAVALIWIFLNHTVERLFGYPYIANPFAGWPPLAERIAQLRPLEGFGIWSIPVNLLRYIGWSGDQGVTLFLILSGFGLTWGLLVRHESAPLRLGPFYRRRAERVYPLWWGAHLLFMALWILTGLGLAVTNPATYLSMLGVRVTPALLYYFAPAWWYVGLLIQLYLIYPLLWGLLHHYGPLWFLIVSCAVAFSVRALGIVLFDGYLDAWLRGAVFITRLPEFVFGISLAFWLHHSPEETARRLRSPAVIVGALAAYLLGTALSLTLLGMVVAPFLLGVGVFVLLYALLQGVRQPPSRGVRPWTWVGQHSYSLYLMHHPLILLLVPAGLAASSMRALLGTVAAALLTVVSAIALEWMVGRALTNLRRWCQQMGIARAARRAIVLVIAFGVLLVGTELLIRWVAPQEVLGWGERPSLEPDPTFGWRLKPAQETRLRWESYDYLVTANSLGFPGPEYSVAKPAGTLRIMTMGDAFTSAEGVDTTQAWPRLLEADLAGRLPGQKIEVLNFAITGYGPNQYAALAEEFVPLYQPDLILIGFFVNEYQDVLLSYDEVRGSIGFDLPSQSGLYSIARLEHLHRFVQLQVMEPIVELLRRRPRSYGYFLGGFAALERGQADVQNGAQQLVAKRLGQIKAVADEIGAQVILLMIPAPVQVCRTDQLTYYPRHVNLTDSTQFDLEQPQRLTQESATDLGLRYYDLRPALQTVGESCPYQPRNMHWTVAGHRAVAGYLAERLIVDQVVSLAEGE